MKRIALALVSSLALAGSAFAATGTPAPKASVQNHHCVAKDGTLQPSLTHKECSKTGGVWKRDAAQTTTAPNSKPAQPAPAGDTAPKTPPVAAPAK